MKSKMLAIFLCLALVFSLSANVVWGVSYYPLNADDADLIVYRNFFGEGRGMEWYGETLDADKYPAPQRLTDGATSNGLDKHCSEANRNGGIFLFANATLTDDAAKVAIFHGYDQGHGGVVNTTYRIYAAAPGTAQDAAIVDANLIGTINFDKQAEINAGVATNHWEDFYDGKGDPLNTAVTLAKGTYDIYVTIETTDISPKLADFIFYADDGSDDSQVPPPVKEYNYPTEEKIIDTIETNMDIGPSGDNYGMVFADLPAGVYKVAYYLTIDSARDGAQMRISPRVGNYRCWIDWKTTEEMNGHVGVKTFMTENDTNKVVLVNVITVPENGLAIDAGFWQDENAYVGTLDKVVLATDGYNFVNETEYTWVDEKGYRSNDPNTTFGEDSEQKILAVEDDWTMSTRPGDDSGDKEEGGNTDVPVTGDISMMVALLAAGAAAVGGIKLRRK